MLLSKNRDKTELVTFRGYKDNRRLPKNLEKKDEWLFKKEFTKEIPNTEVLILKNTRILNDTIFRPSEFRLYNRYSRLRSLGFKDLITHLALLRKPTVEVEKGIWIKDEWSLNYFHFVTDALTRLIGGQVDSDEYFVLLPRKFESLEYVKSFLQLLGFSPYFYKPGVNLKIKELVLPGHTAISGDYNKNIISLLQTKTCVHNKSGRSRKVYISRKGTRTRKVLNEQQVEEVLKKYGYEIHVFENYCLMDQLEIMSETKSLIGMHGAGLTNMLFMPTNASVLEFRRKDDDEFNCYYSLASVLNHDYYYQLSEISGDNAQINIKLLEKNIQRMEKLK